MAKDFFVFEGIDASGKATQVKMLKEHYEAAGRQVVLMDFPDSHGPIGKMIYDVLYEKADIGREAFCLLYAADRMQHTKAIKEALAAGKVVISDRYAYSNLAFQLARGMDLDWLIAIDSKLIFPDHVFLLDLSVDESSNRKKNAAKIAHGESGKKDINERDLDYMHKVRENYLGLAKGKLAQFGSAEWHVLDATKNPDSIAEEAWKIAKKASGV